MLIYSKMVNRAEQPVVPQGNLPICIVAANTRDSDIYSSFKSGPPRHRIVRACSLLSCPGLLKVST